MNLENQCKNDMLTSKRTLPGVCPSFFVSIFSLEWGIYCSGPFFCAGRLACVFVSRKGVRSRGCACDGLVLALGG